MSKKFSSLMEDINKLKSHLTEAYIFDDQDGIGDPTMQQPGQEQIPMQQPQGQPPMEGESEEEKAMHAQEIAKHEPIIMKMREIALQGLQKYSDQPTNDLYEFFKSVFLDSDKVLTGTGSKK